MEFVFKKEYAFIVSLTLLMCACGPGDEYLSLPDPAPRITLASWPQNDEPWSITVAKTVPYFSNNSLPGLPNATVSIYENGSLLSQLVCQNPMDERPSEFVSLEFPRPGNTYRIVVSAEGLPQAEAAYTQPELVPVGMSDVQVFPTDQFVVFEVLFRITFDDPASINYYEVVLECADSADPSASKFYPAISLLYTEFPDRNPGYSVVIDDEPFNGKSTTLDFKAQLFQYPGQPKRPYFRALLRNVSEDYYLYVITTDALSKASDDPYAQPVVLHNNVVNGLGIFAGYTQSASSYVYRSY